MFEKKTYADGTYCPYVGGACVEKACTFWKSLPVEDKETHLPSMVWGCTINHAATLMWEVAVHTRGTRADVESLRNAVIRQDSETAEMQKRIAQAEAENQKMKQVIVRMVKGANGHAVKHSATEKSAITQEAETDSASCA